MRFGIVLTSCWDHVGIFLGPVGMILGPLDTMVRRLDNNLLSVRPMSRIYQDFGSFLNLVGLPFSPSWVTILILGVWNGEICVFCGQPDFRLDFGAKSDEFLKNFEWLRPWFGVGGVVKITVSVEHGFSRFGTPF